jgi:hypothetical protein
VVVAHVYVEGGGDSKELRTRCREGFNKLFRKAGLSGRMPRIVACGGRDATFGSFSTAHTKSKSGQFVAMLVDSEDPVKDIERPWDHLRHRDNWERPNGAEDKQALLMTTCMETWIAGDVTGLRSYYEQGFQENALPGHDDLEQVDRHTVQNALCHATRKCTNAYKKGKRSFQVLAALNPAVLEERLPKERLPSFARVMRILRERL